MVSPGILHLFKQSCAMVMPLLVRGEPRERAHLVQKYLLVIIEDCFEHQQAIFRRVVG